MTKDQLAALRFCGCFNARLTARRLTAFYDARLAPLGINIAQFALMAQIAAAGDAGLGAIARSTGIDASTLSRNVQGLARDGLVEIIIAAGDHRKRTARLSARGRRTLADAAPLWEAAQAEVGALIDLEALRQIARASKTLAPD